MKFFASAVAIVALVPAVLGLTVNTPVNVVECEPIQFTWADGQSPYFLSLVPGGQPSGTPIEQFPSQTGTSFSWNAVALQANTQFTIALKDSTGLQAFSSIVTVLSGDATCLTATTSGGSSSTSSTGGTITSGGSSPTTSGSSAATTSGSASKGSSSSASSSAAKSTTSSNAASRGSSVGAFGVAGIMGLVGAALF